MAAPEQFHPGESHNSSPLDIPRYLERRRTRRSPASAASCVRATTRHPDPAAPLHFALRIPGGGGGRYRVQQKGDLGFGAVHWLASTIHMGQAHNATSQALAIAISWQHKTISSRLGAGRVYSLRPDLAARASEFAGASPPSSGLGGPGRMILDFARADLGSLHTTHLGKAAHSAPVAGLATGDSPAMVRSICSSISARRALGPFNEPLFKLHNSPPTISGTISPGTARRHGADIARAGIWARPTRHLDTAASATAQTRGPRLRLKRKPCPIEEFCAALGGAAARRDHGDDPRPGIGLDARAFPPRRVARFGAWTSCTASAPTFRV